MENKVITIRSVYKVKEYHFQPTKQRNGLNWPWVKPTRVGADGRSEMVLSEAERNNPDHIYFIPEDIDIVVTDGTTFNLADPLQYNKWMAIKDSDLFVPSRDSRDSDGVLLIDGDAKKYGKAELYIDVPGEESERSISRKKLIIKAMTFVEKDSVEGRLTKCKVLGKNMKYAPASDVEDYLYQIAEKEPNRIIDLYTNGDTALRLLFITAQEKGIIKKKNGVFMYGDSVLGMTDDAVINFFKIPSNSTMFEEIKRETFPEFVQKPKTETSKSKE